MKKWKWVALIVVASPFCFILFYFVALWVAHDFNPRFLKIDSCLDSGGKWNYEQNVCEHE
jgi:hypothetical protein